MDADPSSEETTSESPFHKLVSVTRKQQKKIWITQRLVELTMMLFVIMIATLICIIFYLVDQLGEYENNNHILQTQQEGSSKKLKDLDEKVTQIIQSEPEVNKDSTQQLEGLTTKISNLETQLKSELKKTKEQNKALVSSLYKKIDEKLKAVKEDSNDQQNNELLEKIKKLEINSQQLAQINEDLKVINKKISERHEIRIEQNKHNKVVDDMMRSIESLNSRIRELESTRQRSFGQTPKKKRDSEVAADNMQNKTNQLDASPEIDKKINELAQAIEDTSISKQENQEEGYFLVDKENPDQKKKKAKSVISDILKL